MAQIKHKFDEALNDNDKSWVVPVGETWYLNWAHVTFVSTADAGNRQMRLYVLDENSNLLFDTHAGAVQTASNTYHYLFLQGIFRETSFVDGEIQVPIPKDLYLKEGWTLQIADEDDIEATDDMTVAFQYKLIKTSKDV